MNLNKLSTEVSALMEANKCKVYLVGECVLDLLVHDEIRSKVEIATDVPISDLFIVFSNDTRYRILFTTSNQLVIRDNESATAFTVSNFRNILGVACDDIDGHLFSKGLNVTSMAYDVTEKELIDPSNVQEDIKNKVVKINSEYSFTNSPILLFNLAFMCAKLGYKLDGKSAMYAAKNVDLLGGISTSLIHSALEKYFTELKYPSAALRILNSFGVLKRVLPELAFSKGYRPNYTTHEDVYTHTLKVIDSVPKGRPLVRWAALFHDLGKMCILDGCDANTVKFNTYQCKSAKMGLEIMARLSFSRKEMLAVERIVKHECVMAYSSDDELLSFVNKIGIANIQDALLLEASHRISGSYSFDTTKSWLSIYKRRLHRVLIQEGKFTVKNLAVNGYDLMKWLKIEQGPIIGQVLNELFGLVKHDVFSNNVSLLKKLSFTHYHRLIEKST